MGLIQRYIIRAIMPPFLFGASTVVFLFLFQFVVNHLNRFLGKGLSYWVILQLLGYNMAWMFVFSIPIGILFGTVMAFGNMAANQEITVMKSGGISLIKMMYPVIALGIFAGGFLYWFNDNVLPVTNHRAKVLFGDITRKKPTFTIEAGQFSTDLEGYTILARSLDSASGLLKGVTIYDNTHGLRTNLVSADTATIEFSADYRNFILFMKHGEIHQLIPGSIHNYRKVDFERYQIVIPATGFSFVRTNEDLISRGDREMRISELEATAAESFAMADSARKRVNKQLMKHFNFLMGKIPDKIVDVKDTSKTEPNKNEALKEVENRINYFKASILSDLNQAREYKKRGNQYKVEIYKKYAIPFGCLLFVLVGCPLGIITKRGNFGVSAGISLIFYIFYWISFIGGEKLADRGFLSPFVSMWSGNFIITIVAVIIIVRVSNEGFSFKNLKIVKKLVHKE